MVRFPGFIGGVLIQILDHVGDMLALLSSAVLWLTRSIFDPRVRMGSSAINTQIIRVGVRSVAIICLVSAAVGLILSLQMAPPLDELGQKDKLANIIGVAVLRELGPLIGAIVLTGYAGAAITAELGTMVVGEEIEALEAHALNPVRFLVVPRVFATCTCMGALGVFASIVSIAASVGVSTIVLDLPFTVYWQNLLSQVKLVDFLTGVAKALVFGLLIGVIACANGLRVTGGAAGVGAATTRTVVESVVAVVLADLVFTALFYALGLF
ncbi:MAG: ABC transporter permease [Phycisphaerales bacterium]|nr:ABC transporter permease [Phycisphaerales bacterium]